MALLSMIQRCHLRCIVCAFLSLLSAPLARSAIVPWQEGMDRYATLNVTIDHKGSCQPECVEERVIAIPADIPYVVRVEFVEADMHSDGEYLEVKLGSLSLMCNAKPSSDYTCALHGCAQLALASALEGQLRNAGLVELHVRAKSHRTRDSCKCRLSSEHTPDCYSALLSGTDDTYGMLVRITFVPDVRMDWTLGSWTSCNQWQCADPAAESHRSVECTASSEALESVPLSVASKKHCVGQEPASSRSCMNTTDCAPPPFCDACFSLSSLAADGVLYWSAPNPPLRAGELQADPNRILPVELSSGAPLFVKLLPGLADFQAASLLLCTGGFYIVRSRSGNTNLTTLELEEDDGTDDFALRATFRLFRTSTSGYAFKDLAGDLVVGKRSDDNFLSMKSIEPSGLQIPAVTFIARSASDDSRPCVPSDVPDHLPRNACRFSGGWCCFGPLFNSVALGCNLTGTSGRANTCAAELCQDSRIMLIHEGHCEDVNCGPIKSHDQCEAAAAAFGLGVTAGEIHTAGARSSRAQLIMSPRHPRFCAWEEKSSESQEALFFNVAEAAAAASPLVKQLCSCGQHTPTQTLSWSVGDWGNCDLDCKTQRRERHVLCVLTSSAGDVEQPRGRCLEAGLPEPSSFEPCAAQGCFGSLADTRCAGEERQLSDEEAWNLGRPLTDKIGGDHCVDIARSSEESRQVCQNGCTRLANCVGFTLYVATPNGNADISHRCCFLRKVTRWESNYRHAYCHLLHGAPTLSGCHCQVGWVIAEHKGICGLNHGGCCSTAENGAVPWCPTTSPTCGESLQGQQRWDFCDPEGMAAITDGTCQTQTFESRQNCERADGISRCNQIATALGLSDTTPTVTFAAYVPLGCTWQTATSQLWLHLDNASATDVVSASTAFPELCSCRPKPKLSWLTGAWGPCFKDPNSTCGAEKRLRSAWCVLQGIHRIGGGGKIVGDSFCTAPKPNTVEMCSGCIDKVVAAQALFNVDANELEQESYRSNFLQLCHAELARAMNITTAQLRVALEDCCAGPTIHVNLLITGSAHESSDAGEALGQLIFIVRSTSQDPKFWWSSRFHRFASSLSVRMLGEYTWHVHGGFGECSVDCGGGIQRRSVQCVFYDYRTQPLIDAPEDYCDKATKPQHERLCGTRACRSCIGLELGSHYTTSSFSVSMANNGAVVYVTCAAGYGTVDDMRLGETRCADGDWTPLEVSCGRDCQAFELDMWRYEVTGSGMQHGATRQVTCSNRSTRPVESPPSATAICDDGDWISPLIACTGDCQELELTAAYVVSDSDNHSIEGGGGVYAAHGATRQVVCASGFSSPTGSNEQLLWCNDGKWQGQDQLLECKATCPRYQLPESYELRKEGDDKGSWRRVASTWEPEERHLQKEFAVEVVDGLPHGSVLQIRCADRDNRVPGAVEEVQCTDGRWSTLSLVCGKDCLPLNTSSPEYRRYIMIEEEVGTVVTDSGEKVVSEASRRYTHGSVATIACRGYNGHRTGGAVQQTGSPQVKILCENGEWTHPMLRCFDDCPPFEAGPRYTGIVPDMWDESADAAVAHGTRAFGTCTKGYSLYRPADSSLELSSNTGVNGDAATGSDEFQVSDAGNSDANRSSVALDPGPYFEEVRCTDGKWSRLSLRCLRDCQFLRLDPKYEVVGLGSGRVGTTLSVTCAMHSSPVVQLRCSEAAIWHVFDPGKNVTDEYKRLEEEADQKLPAGQEFDLVHECQCVKLIRRSMQNGVTAWNDATDTYQDVPAELQGATLFTGPTQGAPSGHFTATAGRAPAIADVTVFVFEEIGRLNGTLPNLGWERLNTRHFRVGQQQAWTKMSVWQRSLPAGSSLEIPVPESFNGGIAIKHTLHRGALLPLPYKMVNDSSLCSPHLLIETVEECKMAAKSLGVGTKGVQVLGVDTEFTNVDEPWVVTEPYHARNPPGCYLRTDFWGKKVQLTFNPDLGSPMLTNSKEWPVCEAGTVIADEVILDLSKPFPLNCDIQHPTFWEKLSDDEKALIALFAIGLAFSSFGLAYNVFVGLRMQRQKHHWRRNQVLGTPTQQAGETCASAQTAPSPAGAPCTPDLQHSSNRHASGGDVGASAAQRLGASAAWALRSVRGTPGEVRTGTIPASSPTAQQGGMPTVRPPDRCLKCANWAASHVCFPCGHLCMCFACAEELTLRLIGAEDDIKCPQCSGRVECIIDGKPAGLFNNCGRHWLRWPVPSLLGRPVTRHATPNIARS